MKRYQAFILITAHFWIVSIATKILYVLPDNSTNANCPSQPCATFSQYLLDNVTLSAVSNVEYHFLPGEHHIPANTVLEDLHNFSIIGIVNKTSPAVLVGYVITILKSYNVTIANVMFKHSYQDNFMINLYKSLTGLKISWCHNCRVQNAVFINFGLTGTNLIGHLTKILLRIDRTKLLFQPGISLTYSEKQSPTDFLIMSHIDISYEGNKCYHSNCNGIYISVGKMKNLRIIINNSQFYNLAYTAISIKSQCPGNNTIVIENCIFKNNAFIKTGRFLIDVVISHSEKSIIFRNCKFLHNKLDTYLLSTTVRSNKYCTNRYFIEQCAGLLTNISFVGNQFHNNAGGLIMITGSCKVNILIAGPTSFVSTFSKIHGHTELDVIHITNMVVSVIGPVIISMSTANKIVSFQYCDVSFSNNIIFKSNYCDQVIYLQITYIKIMEYANISFIENKYYYELIKSESVNDYKLYPLCIFQFIALRNTITVSPMHYSINIVNNSYSHSVLSLNNEHHKNCLFPFYHFTTHCQWISTGVFHEYNPKDIYWQIIKINNQSFTYHKICYCSKDEGTNCSIDVLGQVYPGQTLKTQLCTPCNDQISVLYAEVNSARLPNSACKVATQDKKLSTITNYSKKVNFTIVSESFSECELFLTASSDFDKINEAYYVKLSPCPIGFTLQNGVCDCDPILFPYIDKCYIDYAAINLPANTWINARSQANSTVYLISDCSMDYCLPYSSIINLIHPDLQCQFNRTGILCSQCQHPLSMVFASSRCMKCTNLHILIITIIVIVAGIVLVVLLYLLNLTVTIGTINGIIFYANIVSINDSVFLINNNVFKPLRVFISFLNLDLGIETCFYNGMDSYDKMWLQLFFPFYLMIIAASIIIASRYSSRILRLTYTRSLPVLATLFLLSYTGVLRIVLTVLFSYSTITHLPSGHKQIVWSIDASVPLFGLKFTILFITCLVLFLLLIPFNITLLFTRYLLQFRLINRFKPLLDAFQGSYKDRYYYWVAIHITLRSLFFTFYALKTKLKLILSTIVLIIFGIYSGYIHPYKNKLINIQEVSLLVNLTILYALSYNGSDYLFSIVTHVMISLGFLQLCIITIYHFLTYTCRFNIVSIMQNIKQNVKKTCNKKHLKLDSYNVALLNIPERRYNYAEYQDGLVSDDFA